MILPIVGFGHPVLRQVASPLNPDHPGLEEFISSMYKTMYNAQGVGLAAPQVGKSLRIFIVDGTPMQKDYENEPGLNGWRKVFINPVMVNEEGEEWPFEEGCLSIPDIREDVYRPAIVTLKYQDELFNTFTEEFSGMKARIIQHEYDHLEGVLFTDHISGFRKQVIRSRLNRITKGEIEPDYPMIFAKKQTFSR